MAKRNKSVGNANRHAAWGVGCEGESQGSIFAMFGGARGKNESGESV